LAACQTAIELLPRLSALHLDLPSRQEILATANGTLLASGAATCAVTLGRYDLAVEFLEASRSVFWSQALHLQQPLDDLALIRPDLSGRLADLSRQLERASFRDTSRKTLSHNIIAVESEGAHCRQLNEEWTHVIKSVQKLDGFEDFMQPKHISALKQAAVSGPIIILTASGPTCFALIVTSSTEVQCLDLPEMSLLRVERFAKLSQALSSTDFDADTFFEKYRRSFDLLAQRELEARIHWSREGSPNMSSDDVFDWLLATLWKLIVKPVFDFLKLQVSKSGLEYFWWPSHFSIEVC
jgi:hypothetical protein